MHTCADCKSLSQVCKVCLQPQPLTEFHRGKGYANGHIKICKNCRAKTNAENQEQTKIYNDAYRVKNIEAIRQKKREYYEDNKTTILQYVTTWQKTHKPQRKEVSQRYYQNHKEEVTSRNLAWREAHPDAVRQIAVVNEARKRARAKNDLQNDLNSTQLRIIFAAYQYRCVYCPPDCPACLAGTHEMTHDHVIPRALGGPNTASNVVPACKSCNSKKGKKLPSIPMEAIFQQHPFRNDPLTIQLSLLGEP